MVYFLFRKRRLWASFLASLVVYWAVLPWRFDDEHYAPIFVVFVFRNLFERELGAANVTLVGLLGSLLIAMVFLIIHLMRLARRRKRTVM